MSSATSSSGNQALLTLASDWRAGPPRARVQLGRLDPRQGCAQLGADGREVQHRATWSRAFRAAQAPGPHLGDVFGEGRTPGERGIITIATSVSRPWRVYVSTSWPLVSSPPGGFPTHADIDPGVDVKASRVPSSFPKEEAGIF